MCWPDLDQQSCHPLGWRDTESTRVKPGNSCSICWTWEKAVCTGRDSYHWWFMLDKWSCSSDDCNCFRPSEASRVDSPSWSDPRCLLVPSMRIWEWQPKKNQLWTLDCQTDFTNMLPRWQVLKHIETTGLEGSRQPLSLNQNGSQPTVLVLVQCDSSCIELLQVQQIQSRTYASRKMFPSRKWNLEFWMSKSPPPGIYRFSVFIRETVFFHRKKHWGESSPGLLRRHPTAYVAMINHPYGLMVHRCL